MTHITQVKHRTITLQVRADRSEELLLELAEDDRVSQITMQVGPSRYVVPVREKGA